jgi:hypothetical protein
LRCPTVIAFAFSRSAWRRNSLCEIPSRAAADFQLSTSEKGKRIEVNANGFFLPMRYRITAVEIFEKQRRRRSFVGEFAENCLSQREKRGNDLVGEFAENCWLFAVLLRLSVFAASICGLNCSANK